MKKFLLNHSFIRIITVLCLISAAFSCGNSDSNSKDYYWWTGYTASQDYDSDGTMDTRVYLREFDSLGRITGLSDTFSTSSNTSHYETVEYSVTGSTTTATNNKYLTFDDSFYSKYEITIENGRKVEFFLVVGDYDHNGTIDLDDTTQYYLYAYDSKGRPLTQHEFSANREQDDTDPDYGKVTGYDYFYKAFEYDDLINKITRINHYFKRTYLSSNSTFLESQPSLDTAPEMTASELSSYNIYEYDSQGNITSEAGYRDGTLPYGDYKIESKILYFYDSNSRMSELRRLKDLDSDDIIQDTETYYYEIYTYNGTERTATCYGNTGGSTIATSGDMSGITVTTFRNESDLLKFDKTGTVLSSVSYKDMDSDGAVTISNEDLYANYTYTYETHSFTDSELEDIQYDNYNIKYNNFRSDWYSYIDYYK